MLKKFFVLSLFIHVVLFLLLMIFASQGASTNKIGAPINVAMRTSASYLNNEHGHLPDKSEDTYSRDDIVAKQHPAASAVKEMAVKPEEKKTKKVMHVDNNKKQKAVEHNAYKKNDSVTNTKKKIISISHKRIMESLLAEKNKVEHERREQYLSKQLENQSGSTIAGVIARRQYLNDIRNKIYAGVFSSTSFSSALETVVKLVQDHSGRVMSVSIIKKSGNDTYDRQVVSAVYRGSPLPLPKHADMFQDAIIMKFSPQRKL